MTNESERGKIELDRYGIASVTHRDAVDSVDECADSLLVMIEEDRVTEGDGEFQEESGMSREKIADSQHNWLMAALAELIERRLAAKPGLLGRDPDWLSHGEACQRVNSKQLAAAGCW